MAKCCIGIDLGGSFIKFGVLDADRRPCGTVQLPTPTDRGADGVVEQMVAGVESLMDSPGVSKGDVLGVGIGSPGPLAISEGVILAMPNIPGMDNCRIRDRVSDALGLPAVLENDANAAAYGEFLCGAGAGVQNMVMLTLGTGIGGGVIIDGNVLHGAHEIGAELGHMIVQPAGRHCGCGQRGCLEQYASATFLAKEARRKIEQEGAQSTLSRILERNGDITSKDIVEAAGGGDAFAAQAWDEAMQYLAVGCVNLCRIFDPDKIVLSGGMTGAGEALMRPLSEHFAKLHWKLTDAKTRIEIAALGNDAGFIGAAGVALLAFGKNRSESEP